MWAKMIQALPSIRVLGLFNRGPVAQLGARFHGMEEVVGSIPTRSTNSLNNLDQPSELFAALRITLANEVSNSRVGGSERLFIRQKYDAKVLRPGFLSEA